MKKMKVIKLFETKWYDCSDWCYRQLGNQYTSKNEDSFLKHNLNLNKYHNKLTIKLIVKYNNTIYIKKLKYEYEKMIQEIGIEIKSIDNNTLKIEISKDGLFFLNEKGEVMLFTYEEGKYKIEIWEEND